MKDTRKIRLAGSMIVAILVTINFYAASYLEPSGFAWWLLPVLTLLLLSIWECASLISNKLDLMYPWSTRFSTRLTLQVLFTSLSAIIIFNIPYSIFKIYSVIYWHDTYSIFVILLVNSFLLIFSLLVTGMQLSLHFLDKWRAAEVNTEIMKRNAVTAQLDILKAQIDPHFLFNNFNALYSLIHESPSQAAEYLLHLSDTYRYLLQNRDQEVVRIDDELRVAKAYVHLLQKRYGNSLCLKWDLDERTADTYIVPLALQSLIENAIKHNILEKEKPLLLHIRMIDPDLLEIKNSLNPSERNISSTKLGLLHLQQRYEYLTDRKIEIMKTSDFFSVRVPLLIVN